MKFGIIAAGEGSRLQQEGINVPKPLIVLEDETMLARLLRIFREKGASEIVVIVNELHPATYESVVKCAERHRREGFCPIRIIRKTTPGSMYSFKEISAYFDEPFCLTTIDTIFDEDAFGDYLEKFKTSDVDALMAVTDYVEDEKPLFVRVSGLKIEDFRDEEPTQYVSGGIYCMKPSVLPVLDACMSTGATRMRDFQRALVRDGLKVEAFVFEKILDVDHASDIAQAEAFLHQKTTAGDVLCIKRDLAFSPQSVEKDLAIMNKVVDLLREEGYRVRCVEEREVTEADRCVAVISMARSKEVLQMLRKWSAAGCSVVNDAASLLRLNRKEVRGVCEALKISVPALASEKVFPQWIKRGDTISATTEKDVCFVATEEGCCKVLETLHLQGVDVVERTEHVCGDLMKFYGVNNVKTNSFFFVWSYPKESDSPEGRFGLSQYNETTHHYAFDEAQLEEQIKDLSRMLGIDIFGGDIIVKEDGTCVLIDFNDFPSFSSCREQAAEAIRALATSNLKRGT